MLQCYNMSMADSCTRKLGPKKRIAPKEVSWVFVSPSLLAQIDLNKTTCEEFSLGMSEWMDMNRVSSSDYDHFDDFKQQPTTKKTQLNSHHHLTRHLQALLCWVCYYYWVSINDQASCSQEHKRILVGLCITSLSGEKKCSSDEKCRFDFSALGRCWTESLAMFVCPRNAAQWWK